MTLKLTPLKSSNLEACHYDPESQTLTVKFVNGGTYSYGGVVQEHYDGLTGADSAGSYFQKHIRPSHKHSKQ